MSVQIAKISTTFRRCACWSVPLLFMLAVSSFWRVAVLIAAIPVQSQHLPMRVVYCLFLLHLLSRKCEGLKCNFNTFLIDTFFNLTPSYACYWLFFAPNYHCCNTGNHGKNIGSQICYLGKVLTWDFFLSVRFSSHVVRP